MRQDMDIRSDSALPAVIIHPAGVPASHYPACDPVGRCYCSGHAQRESDQITGSNIRKVAIFGLGSMGYGMAPRLLGDAQVRDIVTGFDIEWDE